MPWTRAALEDLLDAPTTVAFVARDDHHVVGHVLATAAADEGEILTIAVDPDDRRRGHARALLTACEAAWRMRGIATGWLEVRDDNTAARRLYRSAGWEEAGVRRGYYRDGANAVVMRRALA